MINSFITIFVYVRKFLNVKEKGKIMILDISDNGFKQLLDDEKLYLPIRWDGVDFSKTLTELFDYYISKIENMVGKSKDYSVQNDLKRIKQVCGLLTKTINHYLNGFPSESYSTFKRVMNILMGQQLKIYQKSELEQFVDDENLRNNYHDLKLFRVVSVDDIRPYVRARAFHTPYNLRSKVSTSRYSIAGYPSLYLGTSLDLCYEEIHMNPYKTFALASIFKLERTIEYTNTNVKVIELGVKPQDFLDVSYINERSRRKISYSLLQTTEVKSAYLLWYPIIAACSYIRTNKSDPFAAEYIIPQLLMQWVRNEMSYCVGEEYSELVGIRYFSCASVKASEMGFNYVFPTSGLQKSSELPYCSVLARLFKLTKPIYIHEFDSIESCEDELMGLTDFDYI